VAAPGRGDVQEPDPQSIRDVLRGDTRAFAEIVRAYQEPVWRFLCHLLRDPHLAEDVTQETFLRVHRGLRGFRYQSRFSSWVFQIARNAGLDALRTRERAARLSGKVSPGLLASDPYAGVEVATALDSLSTKLREAVLVVEVFGLSYREAARVLQVPEGTVKSRVFQAREKLVSWFAEVSDAL